MGCACSSPSKEQLLLTAATNGDVEVARKALDGGAALECLNEFVAKNMGGGEFSMKMAYGDDIPLKCSPLICAAWFGHLEVARLLLERGADIEAKAIQDRTPLYFAAEDGRLEVVRLLLDKGAEKDVNATTNSAFTPLATAANHGHLEVVRLLLERGADKNVKSNGKTPLEVVEDEDGDDAAKRAAKEAVRALLR